MNEPLPGQKTTIVAAFFAVAQALAAAGVFPAELMEYVSQAAAGLFGITLTLKALRAKKG